MKRLYFCRHGESEGNITFTYDSRGASPLSPLGKEQADIAGKQAQHDNLVIDLMLVSPLRRAQETADIITPFLGNPPRESYDAIMERDFSVLDGQSYKDRDFETYKSLDHFPGVESTEQLQERAKTVLEYVRSREENNILLVSHSAFGRALMRVIQDKPWQDEYVRDGSTSLPHAEIIQLI